jgi:hypothetical protein
MSKDAVGTVFIVTWLVLFVAAGVIHTWASPALKMKLQRTLPVWIGLLFLTFVYLLGGIDTLYWAAPIVALITYLNVAAVRICPHCGATNTSHTLIPAPKYCQRCSAALGP